MPDTYYKAVRPDGTDFRTGTVRWLPPVGEPLPEGGLIVRHPTATARVDTTDAACYLSVSTIVTDCTGMKWPARLALVEESDAEVWTPEPRSLPNKRASVTWRTVAEGDAHDLLGPQGAEVAAIIERASRLTTDEARRLAAAWVAAWDAAWAAAWAAAWDAAWAAAWNAARDAAWNAARDAAWNAERDATVATLTRDLITPEQHDMLMAPWRQVVGKPITVTAVEEADR